MSNLQAPPDANKYPNPPPPSYAPQPYAVPPQQPGPYAPQPYAVPPQQPGYYPPPGAPVQTTSTVVVTQPATVVHVPGFGESPMQYTCPNCRQSIVTQVHYDVGTFTWLLVGGLFIVGCWPCCLIPFCVDGCKDAVHTCPSCQTVLGYRRRM